jgi:predicted PurR-regulated permease PerM
VVAGGLAVGGVLGAFLSVPVVAIAVKVAHYYRVRPAVASGGGPEPDVAPLDPA